MSDVGRDRRIRRAHGSCAYWLLVAPALILLVALYLVPLLGILRLSFTEGDLGQASTFGNYGLLFTDQGVQRMLWRTTRICVISTILTVFLGYCVAYAMLHVGARQRDALLSAVLLTFWLSVLVRAFAWMILLRNDGPVQEAVQVLAEPLRALGLVEEPVPLLRTEAGVVVGMVHAMLPYAILPLLANMRGIDPRMMMAAQSLGADFWAGFRRVWLPLSRPGILAALILVLVLSLGFYVTPALLGGGKVVLISEYIRVSVEQTLRWGLAAMLASTMLVATLALVFLMSRVVDLRTMFGAG